MERHIAFQEKHASTKRSEGREIITAAFRALAALSATATLTFALLPPADVAAVQQALAINAASASDFASA